VVFCKCDHLHDSGDTLESYYKDHGDRLRASVTLCVLTNYSTHKEF
jgi:hypothetical protein